MGQMKEPAEQLTDFLVKERGYNHRSILVTIIESKIEAMARELADQVVAENPNLAEVIRTRTAQIIARVLRDDTYLSSVVTKAVANSLGQLVADVEPLDRNG